MDFVSDRLVDRKGWVRMRGFELSEVQVCVEYISRGHQSPAFDDQLFIEMFLLVFFLTNIFICNLVTPLKIQLTQFICSCLDFR